MKKVTHPVNRKCSPMLLETNRKDIVKIFLSIRRLIDDHDSFICIGLHAYYSICDKIYMLFGITTNLII